MPLTQNELRYCSEHQILSTCPCTNYECARRGICCECTASHKEHGILNACGRIMAAPLFEKMKELSPDSEAVKYLEQFLNVMEKASQGRVAKKSEEARAAEEHRQQHFSEVMERLQKTVGG
ncbi:MAG: hypothetical protein HYY20_14010 [Candidatus Tectomicrobia bacterium]|uniref:Cytosolic protein n=1 Tax=Tectimicrobiota bacterium TaxID=2528274 RepID=A0A932CSV8_UNCTE|nr:hypothetical protein [Candidatus Tectomicrobia bacterium]